MVPASNSVRITFGSVVAKIVDLNPETLFESAVVMIKCTCVTQVLNYQHVSHTVTPMRSPNRMELAH